MCRWRSTPPRALCGVWGVCVVRRVNMGARVCAHIKRYDHAGALAPHPSKGLPD